MQFVAVYTSHFEQMCRHLLDNGAALNALRGMAVDLLLIDVAYHCGLAVAGNQSPMYTAWYKMNGRKKATVLKMRVRPPGVQSCCRSVSCSLTPWTLWTLS